MTRKGQKNERRTAELYEDAGYKTWRPPRARGGPTDLFGLFDMVATDPEHRSLRLVQVKTNRPDGINAYAASAIGFTTIPRVDVEMVVRRDGHGGRSPRPPMWRLIQPKQNDGEVGYHSPVDESREETPTDGDGVVEFLREEIEEVLSDE